MAEQIQALQQQAKNGECKNQLARDFNSSRETLYHGLKEAA